MKIRRKKEKGQIIILVIVFVSIAAVLVGSLINLAVTNVNAARHAREREQAFQLAEAGVEYYRWHLAHASSDFQDGTGGPGPYIHDVQDKDGDVIGQFSLEITAPFVGSTLTKIESTGIPLNSTQRRTIAVDMAIPSLARYAVVANATMRFGEGTEVFGELHSNGGVRFDGLAHNLVTSALGSYDDPDHSGSVEFGVHTHVNPPPGSGTNDSWRPLEAPPSTVSPRPDVFIAGRTFPVPDADFVGLTNDLAQIKNTAQTDGVYYAPSGAQGYEIEFLTNNTFNIYRVDSLVSASSGCYDVLSQSGWGTWSVNSTTLLANRIIPLNGLVFIEDHVWVKGQIDSSRVTIASGRFPDNPSTRTSITVNEDLLYTAYDGTDSIALIAQDNINVGLISEDDLHIDAALVAQNGRVGRYYYRPPYWFYTRCSPDHEKSRIALNGMIATNQRYGFAYTDGNGYQTRDINYDANLLYSPPPSFPLTSALYETLTWVEL